jgi:ubiquinone/menaquinone biosynthesis C-methylase UbiE
MDFRPKYLEDSRKYILTPALSKFIYNCIGVKKNNCVLDVGCGSGFFTREIVKHQKGFGKVTGVDINPDLISEAKKLSKSQNNPEFKEGDGQSLGFIDNSFDVTICHFVLSRLPEEKSHKVLSEMLRVTKQKGILAVVEPCLGAMVAQYYNDYELSLMLTTLRRAKSEAQKILYNINENIGGLMFEIFTEMGLKNISTEIIAMPWWTPPPFPASKLENDSDFRDWYERRLSALTHPDDKENTKDYGKIIDAAQVLRFSSKAENPILLETYEKIGINIELIRTVQEHRINYLQNLLSTPGNAFVNDFEIIPVFVVAGKKE